MNSRLPQPKSRLAKIPQKPIPPALPLKSYTTDNLPQLPTIKPNLLRRRSKSCTNLKEELKPKTTKKPLLKITTKQPAIKLPIKRAAIEPIKEVKEPKKPKVQPWDYKGRLAILDEKYKKLQETLKEYKNKVKDLDKLSSLEVQCTTLSENNRKLNEHVVSLNRENEELKLIKEKYVKLEPEHTEMVNKFKMISSEKEELSKNMKILSEENDKIANERNCLKTEVLKHENLRRQLHNTIQDLKGNIRVFCRIRPPINSYEREERLQCCFNYINEQTFEIRKSRETVSRTGKPCDMKQDFTFDKVFPPCSTQDEVFEELALLVQSALDGYDVCVFAYGQTGSGKTYTMEGGSEPGMIPKTIDHIFKIIDQLKLSDWIYSVQASFLEIYNETVHDLLNIGNSNKLEIRFNEGKGSTVTNLTVENIRTARDLKRLVNLAQENRAVAATNFNEHSSRSHSVTRIYLNGVNKETNIVYNSSISLVDLAGSESAKSSSDERMTETKNINKSLSALGSVMMALHNKDAHIPYRNSKLTFLLQSSLGGSAKTLMFVNIAPFEDCYNETINSLRFASKVKEVKTVSKRNKTLLQN